MKIEMYGIGYAQQKTFLLLSLGQDVLAEVGTVVANNVAGSLVVADVDGPVVAGAEFLGAANRLGVLPDD